MANSLYQQMMRTTNPSNLFQIINTIKQSSNPTQMLLNLANQNSTVSNVLQEIQANGGNAKDLFYRKASQMGVDPNSILSQLQ